MKILQFFRAASISALLIGLIAFLFAAIRGVVGWGIGALDFSTIIGLGGVITGVVGLVGSLIFVIAAKVVKSKRAKNNQPDIYLGKPLTVLAVVLALGIYVLACLYFTLP